MPSHRTRTVLVRVRRAAWALLGGLAATAPLVAHAHHGPGAGSSQSKRSLDGMLGGSAAAQTRLALLGSYALARRVASPAHTGSLSLVGQWAPRPIFSIGLSVPAVWLRPIRAPSSEQGEQEESSDLIQGLGDVEVSLRLTPTAGKSDRHIVTIGVDASLATRTYVVPLDPGRTWGVAPSFNYTRNFERAYLQALVVAGLDLRPAGSAIDLSAGGQVGWRFAKGFAVFGGALVDVRAATFCTQRDGSQIYCTAGRATEFDRPAGAFRAHARGGASWTTPLATRGSDAKERSLKLFVGIGAPMTPRRDFDFAASLGSQISF